MKPKRIVDHELLEEVRNLVCLGCASVDPDGAREAMYDNQVRSHAHHVISRGAGGDDVATNVMPLCFKHHSEIHRIGLSQMCERYSVIKSWVEGAEKMKEEI